MRHFAGEVLYEARAFLSANHDTLHSAGGSAAAWLATSSRPHIASLFSGRGTRPVLSRSRSTFSSVGQTFATDLGSLLTTLQNANTVHYVRCLKHSTSTAHYSLLTTNYSLLTTHYLLLTTH